MKLPSKYGQAELIDIIGIFILIVGAVIFIALLLPSLISDIYGLLAQSSAEVVGRDLAGLITISAAAPNEIIIRKAFSTKHSYNVEIDSRLVQVKLLTVEYGMKGEAITKTAIDNLRHQFDNVNYFKIRKFLDKDGNAYSIEADLVTS